MTFEEKKLLYHSMKEKNLNKKFKNLTSIYNNNKEDYFVIFNILIALGKLPEYRERSKELLLLLANSFNPYTIYFNLGKLELLDKNYDKACEYFNSIPKLDSYYPNAMLELARNDLRKNDKVSAKEKLKMIAEKYNDKVAYAELGAIAEQENNDSLALMYYDKSRKLQENNPKILFRIAKLYKKNGEKEKAEELFKRILELDGKDVQNLLELGISECENGNSSKAKEYFYKIIKINPNDVAAYLELGLLEEMLENYDVAEKYYLNVLAINPNDNLAKLRLTLLYKRQQKYNQSEEYLLKIENYEQKGNMVLERINLKLKKEEIEEALYLFIKLINSEEVNEVDPRNLKRIELHIKYRLGLLTEEGNRKPNHYFYQLIDYNEDRIIEKSKEFFDEDIDYEQSLSLIKEKIIPENLTTIYSGTDFYDIDLGYKVGKIEGKETTFVRVLTVLNSDKILCFEPFVPNSITFGYEEEKQKIRSL